MFRMNKCRVATGTCESGLEPPTTGFEARQEPVPAMMPSVAPSTLRRPEQDLKKFNYLCGLSIAIPDTILPPPSLESCVLCGEKFRLDSAQARCDSKNRVAQ
jgi:hypothetical protein